MFAWFERLKIWAAVRWGWLVPGRQLSAVHGFQATEADGVWHLHRAMERLDDPEQRAFVFTHSLEEESHADEFARVFKEESPLSGAPPQYERDRLYELDEAPWKTFAYVHVGEVDATNRFKQIARHLDDGSLREALQTIVRDEEGHVDLTHDMLLQMGAQERDIKKEFRRVRGRRAWEGWLRAGKRITDAVISLQLSLLYYLFGALLVWSARRKLRERTVLYDNNSLKQMR